MLAVIEVMASMVEATRTMVSMTINDNDNDNDNKHGKNNDDKGLTSEEWIGRAR